MASGLVPFLNALLAILLGYILLTVHRNLPRDGFKALDHPGPVLWAAVGALRLDGLTLVRTVKMPTIRIALPGLGTVKVSNSTSELVFKILYIREVNVEGVDVGTSPVNLSALVDVDMTGTLTMKLDFDLAGTMVPDMLRRTWRKTSSTRFSTRMIGIQPRLGFQLGTLREGQPCFKAVSVSFPEGRIEALHAAGTSLGFLARLIPLDWTISPVTKYLINVLGRNPDTHVMLQDLWRQAGPYLDLSTWANLTKLERQDFPSSNKNIIEEKSSLHAIVKGQTAVVDIALPDHSPPLYREGGKRAYLQSWNKITSEFTLDITQNAINRLTFDRAVLEWNTYTSRHKLDSSASPSNVMVCRLENFNVLVTSKFDLAANLTKPIQLISGLRTIGERGKTRAMVRSSSVELAFEVVSTADGIVIKTLSVEDFDSIDVSIDGLKFKQDEVLNHILKFLKPHIATMASYLLKQFLSADVQKATQIFANVEEGLLVHGVEIPGWFRARPTPDSSEKTVIIEDAPDPREALSETTRVG